MSLRLLIDEDSQSNYLVKLLRASGHDVLTINEAGMTGAPDEEVLELAQENKRVVLTQNCKDFSDLHKLNANHYGIFAIYQNQDSSKDMNYPAVLKAINNIEASEMKIEGQFTSLNDWNY